MTQKSTKPRDRDDREGQQADIEPLARFQRGCSEEFSDCRDLNHYDLKDRDGENDRQERLVFPNIREWGFGVAERSTIELMPELEHDENREEDRQRFEVLRVRPLRAIGRSFHKPSAEEAREENRDLVEPAEDDRDSHQSQLPRRS